MTYSIVAIDQNAGEIGVAVQTGLPGVGTLCPWAEAGIGAVATQALVRVAHGPNGLTLMRRGFTAQEALAATLAGDAGADVRQVGMVDVNGISAAHTGENTIRYAGHRVGQGYAVQANMMANETVPGAMAEVFEGSQDPLALRLLAAMDAAQSEGGDFRGMQSAALKVVSTTLAKSPYEGVLHDWRVDDDPMPLEKLRKLVNTRLAYVKAGEAETQAAQGDMDAAMTTFDEAIALAPQETQLRFWFYLEMADAYGQFERISPLMQVLFQQDPMWIECLIRSSDARPLKTKGLREKLVALGE